MTFDRIAAKNAGYTDAEIEDYLVSKGTDTQDFSGYKDQGQIDTFDSSKSETPSDQGNKEGMLRNLSLGALKGASDIGSTLLWPVDKAGLSGMTNQQRREIIAKTIGEYSNPESVAFKTGEIGANIAGTLPVGGVLSKGLRAIPAISKNLPGLVSAVSSGGGRIATTAPTTIAGKAADLTARTAGGAITGAATAGAITPEDAGAGAMLGAVIPGAGAATKFFGRKAVGTISPEVKALFVRAKELGIDIPVDRIANSRPLNAVAASLNYVPLSGRASTENKMMSQMNKALSRTFGQDSDNVTMSLRKAHVELGKKFEDTLRTNKLKTDDQFLSELVDQSSRANSELGAEGAAVINKQIDNIISKSVNGEIDGKAAYNFKKTLDRIGARNTPEAHYARDLKRKMMEALERSIGDVKAKEFATVRKQYGNMLDLEKIAQSGAEGGVSIGRLAGMKNIGNSDLQELADIASQFVKTRESPHGAMQRIAMTAIGVPTAYSTGMLPALAGITVGGRLANTALNSKISKNILLGEKPLSGIFPKIGRNAINTIDDTLGTVKNVTDTLNAPLRSSKFNPQAAFDNIYDAPAFKRTTGKTGRMPRYTQEQQAQGQRQIPGNFAKQLRLNDLRQPIGLLPAPPRSFTMSDGIAEVLGMTKEQFREALKNKRFAETIGRYIAQRGLLPMGGQNTVLSTTPGRLQRGVPTREQFNEIRKQDFIDSLLYGRRID